MQKLRQKSRRSRPFNESMSIAEDTGTVSDDGVAPLETSSVSTGIENSPIVDIENTPISNTGNAPVIQIETPVTEIENIPVDRMEISPAPLILHSKIIPVPEDAPNTTT